MADAPIVLDVRSIKELSDSSTTWRIDPNAVGYGFNEDRNYRIRKPTEGDRLLIDDEAVETDDGEWVWSPGFYAGQVRAELLGPDDRVRTTYLLDVSPHPDKLGGDIFQSMLDQIWEFDPSLVLGTEPATLPIGHDPRIEDPWLEYARLRSEGDNFVRALSAIVSHPLRDLRAERALLPLQYVRRADRQTALAALRNAGLLTVSRSRRLQCDADHRSASVRRARRPGNTGQRRQSLHCRHRIRGVPPRRPVAGKASVGRRGRK